MSKVTQKKSRLNLIQAGTPIRKKRLKIDLA